MAMVGLVPVGLPNFIGMYIARKYKILSPLCQLSGKNKLEKSLAIQLNICFNRPLCQNIIDGTEEKLQKTSGKEVSYTGLEYYESKVRFVGEQKKNGKNLYPHQCYVSHSAKDIKSLFKCLNNEEVDSTVVSVAGRLFEKRESSKKLKFFNVVDDGTRLQVVANYKFYEEKEKFHLDCGDLSRGDIIIIKGLPMRTKAGELSLRAINLQVLAPCLHALPSSWNKVKNSETIQRNRYLDLLFNESSRERFILRSKIISYIRKFFEQQQFIEVETPILNTIPGGASATPFKTHHKDLNLEMFLRVAPELYLKMLIVGGFNKIFEIGRQFRNEGIDRNHNPEFTACEFYMTYATYKDMMELTEKLLSSLVCDIFGTYQLPYHINLSGEKEMVHLNFKPPFQKIDFIKSIEEQLNTTLPSPEQLQTIEAKDFLLELCKKHDLILSNFTTTPKILEKLFEKFVEPSCINPTFVLNYPTIMRPLAKEHQTIDGLTESLELFIGKQEICNAYTELNDPLEQRLRFQQQEEFREAGDNEAQIKDENYITALEHGLPPTGGWGMGIDRLVMLLTNANNIKEVILFPTLRPAAKSKYKMPKIKALGEVAQN